MVFISAPECAFLRAASRLAFCNPFLPERVEHERAALGREFETTLARLTDNQDVIRGIQAFVRLIGRADA